MVAPGGALLPSVGNASWIPKRCQSHPENTPHAPRDPPEDSNQRPKNPNDPLQREPGPPDEFHQRMVAAVGALLPSVADPPGSPRDTQGPQKAPQSRHATFLKVPASAQRPPKGFPDASLQRMVAAGGALPPSVGDPPRAPKRRPRPPQGTKKETGAPPEHPGWRPQTAKGFPREAEGLHQRWGCCRDPFRAP